jgi:Ala-tRNA(Pro) deacylase
MSINARLQKLLDEARTGYAVLPHRDAFSAQEVAETSHVKGRRLAKVVVLRDIEGNDFMVVVPASEQIDQRILRRVTGKIGVQLEDEQELMRLFPDCEVGAIPPFGNLYHMPMFVDPCLLEDVDVFFQAGNHHEIVLMRTAEYNRIARPFHVRGCLHPAPGGEELAVGAIEEETP